jgi:regulator of replication initiation timing
MLKPRFRLLRDHYFQNIESIHQCIKHREKIEHDLRKSIQDLAHVYLEVQKLRPRFEEVEMETNADSVELHIIAKQRAMINDKRKMIESTLKNPVVNVVEPIIDKSADITKHYLQIRNKVVYY